MTISSRQPNLIYFNTQAKLPTHVYTNKKIDLYKLIEEYPNFPKQGILFRDINPVYRDNDAMNHISNEFYSKFGSLQLDYIGGIESRGFVIATALALKFGKGMIMIRKIGKLPGQTIKKSYDIEYGKSVMELQDNAIKPGESILIADDLVATGGSAIAAASLVEELGGRVAGFAFVIELASMDGADKLRKMGYQVHSLVVYD
jgi:adenine phosphoribosyltransferase